MILPALPRGTSYARLEAYAIETATLLKQDRYAAIRRRTRVATEISAAYIQPDYKYVIAFGAVLLSGGAAQANLQAFSPGTLIVPMDESASMLCARVVRGINSTAKDDTPVAAIS